MIVKISSKRKYILGGFVLALTIAFVVVLIYYWDEIQHLRSYGYSFVFLICFFGAFSLPNPFPSLVIVFASGGVLNPALVGAVAGLGGGLGVTLFYLLGRGGSRFLSKISLFSPGTLDTNEAPPSRLRRWTSRILDWARRRGSIAVFIISLLLVPGVFTPIAIAMGALRFHPLKFFLWCWAGNTVRSLLVAYCGYFGLGSLLRWLGISI